MDQLRGYAIAGMIFVNYLGGFEKMPWMVKHHREGMSYADTIAPLFMFVVGMAFRLSFQRRAAKAGVGRARWEAFRRFMGIAAVGFVFAGADYKVGFWDALGDIGLAGVIAIPFMELRAPIRVVVAFALVTLYQYYFVGLVLTPGWLIHAFAVPPDCATYGQYVMGHNINGGPLGPVSYAFVLLMGTVGYDLLATGDRRKILTQGLAWGAGLSLLGLALKAPWGTIKPEWPFSQYGMSAPYPIYSTGLAFLAFVAFHLLCDVGRIRIPTLTILAENALVMYLLHNVIIDWLKDALPKDAGPEALVAPSKALAAFAVIYGLCYAVARKLHNDRIIIKM